MSPEEQVAEFKLKMMLLLGVAPTVRYDYRYSWVTPEVLVVLQVKTPEGTPWEGSCTTTSVYIESLTKETAGRRWVDGLSLGKAVRILAHVLEGTYTYRTGRNR